MFSFHKPRVYRSTEGCCICRAKSSSSRFTDSKKYEDDSMKCFNLDKPRQGEICNACVLLVKRFKRLPAGSNRHWGHVVDARIGPGMKSMTKFKKMKEESSQQQNSSENTKAQNSKSSIPEKFCKIFKKNKKKQLSEKSLKQRREGTPGSWDEQSLPPTPESLNSDCEDIQYSSTFTNNRAKFSRYKVNRRKILKPRRYRRNLDQVNFFDEIIWKRLNSCCGIVYENSQIEALIIDIASYKPCPDHKHLLLSVPSNDSQHLINTEKTEINCSNNSNELNNHHQMYLKRTSSIINEEHSTSTPALKKHHLFFKRQLENFPRGEISISNSVVKTDADSTVTRQNDINDSIKFIDNISRINKHTLLHKIKSDTGKIVKHSLEKINTLRIKQTDISDIKNLIKIADKPLKIRTMDKTSTTLIQGNKAIDPSSTKFSDNSSDSGFDENLQERKSISPLQEEDEKEKKILIRPTQTMFLASGVQVQGQQQNLILTANEVAAKMLQSRRQLQNPFSTKHAQSSGSQKIRAIFNPTSEGIISIAGNAANSTAMLNVAPSSVSSLNQKIILVKAKYNNQSSN